MRGIHQSRIAGILSFLLLSSCAYYRELRQPLTSLQERREYLRPILNETELHEMLLCNSSDALDTYLDKYWALHDPTPGTELNELKVEYESRVNYVRKWFPVRKGWRLSDQARIYIVYGPPDDLYRITWNVAGIGYGSEAKEVEVWVYDYWLPGPNLPCAWDYLDAGRMKFGFVDFSGLGVLSQVYSNVPGEKINPLIYQFDLNNIILKGYQIPIPFRLTR
jgi:GWxTD domain-containing protein